MYERRIDSIDLVDFSNPHDEKDYLHYSFAVFDSGGRKTTYYESIEKSTRSVVYRGLKTYWERRDPEGYRYKMFKRRKNYKEIVRRHKSKYDVEDEDDYINVSADELLEKKMKEILNGNSEEK